MLLAALALTAVVAVAPAQASASVYVGTGPGYFLAFEIRNGHPYVLALTARTYCRGTGAHRSEHLGSGPAGMFASPARMSKTGEGYRGFDETYYPLWREHAVIEADVRHRRAIVGNFVMAYEDAESECWTGGYRGDFKVAFRARKYIPISSPRARSLVARGGGGGIYFAKTEALETLIRRLPDKSLEVRGEVGQRCPTPAAETDPPRVPMFSGLIAAAPLGNHGGFRKNWHFYGAGRHRATYNERMSMTGRVKPAVLVGRYHRVKVRKRGERVIRRCETGARFRAKRYVRAR